MGKKPLLGLAGMFLAGLALTGCENSNPRPFGGQSNGGRPMASNGMGTPVGTNGGQYAGRTMPTGTTAGTSGGFQNGVSTTSSGFNGSRPVDYSLTQQPQQGYPPPANFGSGPSMSTGGPLPGSGQPTSFNAPASSSGGLGSSGSPAISGPRSNVTHTDPSIPSSGAPLSGAPVVGGSVPTPPVPPGTRYP